MINAAMEIRDRNLFEPDFSPDFFFDVTGEESIKYIRNFVASGKKFYDEAMQQPFMPIHRQKEMKRALDKLNSLASEAETEYKTGRKNKIDNYYRKIKRAYNDVANTQWKNKAWTTVKKYNLLSSLSRNAFLGLTRLNIFSLAKKMNLIKIEAEKGNEKASEGWAKLKYRWVQIGGDWESLSKAIDAGKEKTPPFVRRDEYIKKYNVAGVDDAAALIAQSAPTTSTMWSVIANVLEVIGTISGVVAGSISMAKGGVSGDEMPEELLKQGEDELKAEGKSDLIDNKNNMWWWIGGGIAVAAIITIVLVIVFNKKK